MPVTVVLGDKDEFIKPEHAAHLVRAAFPAQPSFRWDGVSHFAPLQRPDEFNRTAVLAFLDWLP